MQQFKFAGSWYNGIHAAAAAWADTALPDPSVVGDDEDAGAASDALESFWWGEAQKIGEGAPNGVDANEWRTACREALVERIETSRKAK